VNELRGVLHIQLWRKTTRIARGPEKEPAARDFRGEWEDRMMGCAMEGNKRCSGKLSEGAKQYGGKEIERDGE
jgi:hypothetical protein